MRALTGVAEPANEQGLLELALELTAAQLERALRAYRRCENYRFVDAHHIEHWARGGETSIDNLLLLCRRHHRLLHEGGYPVERLPDGELRFRYPWGQAIPDTPRPPPGSLAALRDQNGTDVSSNSYRSEAGDRVDLDLTVAALLAAES